MSLRNQFHIVEINETRAAHVKLQDDRRFVCFAVPTNAVSTIKGTIRSAVGVAVERQRLVLGGAELEDTTLVRDAGIAGGSVVHMCLRSFAV